MGKFEVMKIEERITRDAIELTEADIFQAFKNFVISEGYEIQEIKYDVRSIYTGGIINGVYINNILLFLK